MRVTLSNIFLLLLLGTLSVHAQRIPEMIEDTEVYDFIEELTTDGVIRSNAAIKPYTRDLSPVCSLKRRVGTPCLISVNATTCISIFKTMR